MAAYLSFACWLAVGEGLLRRCVLELRLRAVASPVKL